MRHLATAELPVERLRTYPGNARRSDLTPIAESLTVNGQYRGLVVRADNPERPDEGGVILAGNHTYLAATEKLGFSAIRCELIECDDDEARRILLVDNKLPDRAGYDEDALIALLQEAADADGLTGTGWTEADLEKLAGEQLPEPGDAEVEDLPALYGVSVECDTEEQQAELLERLAGEGLRVRALMR
jgi:ParB-like chromosome segregation protein Spo0J